MYLRVGFGLLHEAALEQLPQEAKVRLAMIFKLKNSVLDRLTAHKCERTSTRC